MGKPRIDLTGRVFGRLTALMSMLTTAQKTVDGRQPQNRPVISAQMFGIKLGMKR